MKLTLVLLLGWSFANGADRGEVPLRSAFEAHRWFDLRDAVTAGKTPPLYRFAVAAAFNDLGGAEREFRAVMRSGAGRDEQYAAHAMLSDLYRRNGYYRRAAAETRRNWALGPDREPPEQERAEVRTFEQLPDLAVVSRRPATVHSTTTLRGLVVAPLTINGHDANFVLDTGANMSVISEAEAKRLDMHIRADTIPFFGPTGPGGTGARLAIADRLTFGGSELHNVVFMVFRDDQGPWVGAPLGQRGVVGLPVLLAVQTLRWNREHGLDVGFRLSHADLRSANLCFERAEPLVAGEAGARRVAFVLDTGAEGSEVWPLFGKEFPMLLQDARKGTKELIGMSGSASLDAAIVPALRISLAGFPILFRDAPVLFATTVAASYWHYGRIGIDLLSQAEEVTLDFKAMKVLTR